MEIWTARQVKDFLRVSTQYVYKLANQGTLPCIKIPCEGEGKQERSVIRFLKDDIEAFVKNYYVGGALED